MLKLRTLVVTGMLMAGLIVGIAVPVFAKSPASLLPRANLYTVASTKITDSTNSTKPGVHSVTQSQVKKPKFKTLQGIVKSVSSDSLTLTVQKTDYVVTPSDKVRIVNRIWKPIKITDIQTADTVRVFGAITDTSVTANVIRDVSLPTNATNTIPTYTPPMH